MGDTIRLKTNQQRLIANLRHAFNPSSMLGELLQNARRAKASHILVEADDNSLTVIDDGIGIADLQSLIFIAESGWDEETQERENAFGMGVLSTLYFSECLWVHSGSKSFSASTAEIIAGEPIQVHEAPPRAGTGIKLDGVQPPFSGITLQDWVWQQLLRLCEAFPVRVSFNGDDVPRPLADPALAWRETPVGKILIDLNASYLHWRTFLQGLPIGRDPGTTNYHIVLLRDDMIARLPDRQHLLNETEDNQTIQAAVNQAFREALIEAKASMSSENFIEVYGNTCLASLNAYLLNDIPFAHRAWFRNWKAVPPGYSQFWERIKPGGVIAEDVLGKAGVWNIDIDDSDDTLTAEAYINASNGFLLEEHRLHPDHWLNRMVRSIPPDHVTVRPGQILHEDRHLPLADAVDLVLTDTLFLSLTDNPVEYPVSAVRAGDVIYITTDASDVTRLISDYIFDDRYDDNAEDEDADTIRTFVAVGQSQDPARVIDALLSDQLRYTPQSKLANATVRLVFDEQGRLKNVIS